MVRVRLRWAVLLVVVGVVLIVTAAGLVDYRLAMASVGVMCIIAGLLVVDVGGRR